MEFGLVHLTDPRLSGLVAESRAFYARRVAGRGPSSPEELRAIRAKAADPAPSYPPAAVEVVCTGGRNVPVRIHLPASGEVAGVLLEIHGGGFYLGSAASSDVRNRNLADALALAVVSVDYRLAPEHPWPAAPDDCETAARWLADHAEHRFGTTKLSIGGFSAGATLAMTTLLRLRDQGITAYSSAVLQFGTYDLSAQTPAGRLIADEYFLDAYAGTVEDRTTRTSRQSTPISQVYRRSSSSSGPTTSCWKTTWRWPCGSRRPASTSTSASTPPHLTGSPAMRPPWREPRWTTSRAGCIGTYSSHSDPLDDQCLFHGPPASRHERKINSYPKLSADQLNQGLDDAVG